MGRRTCEGAAAYGYAEGRFWIDTSDRLVIYLGMPRPSNPDVRRRLIESGLKLISKQGFAGSGVADITASAGIPKGSFYQYFESKQSYAIELLDDYWRAVEDKHTKVLLDDRYAPLDRIARHFHSIGQ